MKNFVQNLQPAAGIRRGKEYLNRRSRKPLCAKEFLSSLSSARRMRTTSAATEVFPSEAAMGGAETMYPEFRDKIKEEFTPPAPCKRNCGAPPVGQN
jgi:hypothetical protein